MLLRYVELTKIEGIPTKQAMTLQRGGTVLGFFSERIGDALGSGFCDDDFHTLDAAPGSLSDFDGEEAAGDWTLTITDTEADGDAGQLDSWQLLVASEPCDEPEDLIGTPDCVAQEVLLSWTLPASVDPASRLRSDEVQTCANCQFIQGEDGKAWRPCQLIPGKAVAAAGWCSAWAPKA